MANYKFRRGQRVEFKSVEWDTSTASSSQIEVWRVGSVTNPSVSGYHGSYVRIRRDGQQPYEVGEIYREDDVRADQTGRTEYERRKYDLRYLTHGEIAALKLALENVTVRDDVLTDEVVQKLLRQLPTLP